MLMGQTVEGSVGVYANPSDGYCDSPSKGLGDSTLACVTQVNGPGQQKDASNVNINKVCKQDILVKLGEATRGRSQANKCTGTVTAAAADCSGATTTCSGSAATGLTMLASEAFCNANTQLNSSSGGCTESAKNRNNVCMIGPKAGAQTDCSIIGKTECPGGTENSKAHTTLK